MLLNHPWVNKEIRKHLETNENRYIMPPNLGNRAKAVLRKIHSYTGLYQEKEKLNNLTLCLKN